LRGDSLYDCLLSSPSRRTAIEGAAAARGDAVADWYAALLGALLVELKQDTPCKQDTLVNDPFSNAMMDWYVSHLRHKLRPGGQRFGADEHGATIVVNDPDGRQQLRDRTRIHTCRLSGDLGGAAQPPREFLIGELELQGQIVFYGTLGAADVEFGRASDHEHEFIAVTHWRTPAIIPVLASARLHHYAAEQLGDHHTFLLAENSVLREQGYTRVLVTRADLYPPFDGNNAVTVAGRHVRLHALVLLTEDEFRVKAEQGVNALFNRLQGKSGRHLLEYHAAG
jgi:hypothetical protein